MALVVVGTLYDILFVQLKILTVTTKKVAPFDSPPPYDVSEEPLLSKTTTASMEHSDTPVLPPYSGYGTVPEKENQGPDEEKKPKEGNVRFLGNSVYASSLQGHFYLNYKKS